jgi:amino acid permease
MPLTLLRHLSGLRYVATLALGVCIWVALLSIIYISRRSVRFEPCTIPGQRLPCGGAAFVRVPANWRRFGKYAGTVVLAYSCQMNVFTIFNEIKEATEKRANSVIAMGHLISGTVYTIVGLVVYATYGEAVQSNMLMSYPDDMPMAVTRLLYIVVAVVSYPILMNPARVATFGLWHHVTVVFQEVNLPLPAAIVEPAGPEAPPSNLKFFSFTFFLLALSLAIGLFIEDLGIVYGIIGATASTSIVFIIPGLMYMKVFEQPHFKRTLAAGLFCFGCVMMPVLFVCAVM